MAKSKFSPELAAFLAVLISLFLLWDPVNWFRPNSKGVMITAVFFAGVSFFALLVWKERVRDEREEFHRMMTDRVSFLVGAAMSIIVLLEGVMNNNLRMPLLIVLAAMVLAKIIGILYMRFRS